MVEEAITPRSILMGRLGQAVVEHPEKAKGYNCVYKFKIDGDQGGIWTLDLASDPPSMQEADKEAQCTICMQDADFVSMVAGTLKPEVAFMSGQLMVKGDISLALRNLFQKGRQP
jgi:putative sterol carrier protein